MSRLARIPRLATRSLPHPGQVRWRRSTRTRQQPGLERGLVPCLLWAAAVKPPLSPAMLHHRLLHLLVALPGCTVVPVSSICPRSPAKPLQSAQLASPPRPSCRFPSSGDNENSVTFVRLKEPAHFRFYFGPATRSGRANGFS